jgi:DNA adenine methylase
MNGPLKSHGGKHYLARQIIALMPPHLHYIEPYFGGGAVLFAKQHEGVSEVVNDLNGDLMNFWRVLQEKKAFTEFKRRMEAVPFSECQWQEAKEQLAEEQGASRKVSIDRAIAFFILCRQSMAGRCQDFAPISKTRTRRGMNEQASAWMQCVDGLPAVHARLRRVVILNRPALEVLRAHDTPTTLSYLDPPYLPETRTSKGVFGPFDMTAEQHEELLATVKALQGKVMLSGYPSKLYESRLAGWQRHSFDLPNNAAGDIAKRRMTECIWCNFKTKALSKEAG